ncbi:hypothetical protein Cch01nite_31800 [Cellulomonas chitinilytica]|uniref:Uncharacterized protein n=1 Tax=Cellulomonas chitinilytica TaxID=398759 RepID=A0A919P6E3_9CELL|nr:hypothetical protein [Cellulomonas chitinilytica]GIG22456.1 hypothetical protein Cch01nite_31800 [Cellulomonas chitinilytica]
MRAGSDGLWAVSEALGVVPGQIARDSIVGRLIDAWWAEPRTRGCPHPARTYVALPALELLCPACAVLASDGPLSCAVCGQTLTRRAVRRADAVLAEDGPFSFLGVVGRCCGGAPDAW